MQICFMFVNAKNMRLKNKITNQFNVLIMKDLFDALGLYEFYNL